MIKDLENDATKFSIYIIECWKKLCERSLTRKKVIVPLSGHFCLPVSSGFSVYCTIRRARLVCMNFVIAFLSLSLFLEACLSLSGNELSAEINSRGIETVGLIPGAPWTRTHLFIRGWCTGLVMQKWRTFNPTLDKIPYLFPRAAGSSWCAGLPGGPHLFHLLSVRKKNRRVSRMGTRSTDFLPPIRKLRFGIIKRKNPTSCNFWDGMLYIMNLPRFFTFLRDNIRK